MVPGYHAEDFGVGNMKVCMCVVKCVYVYSDVCVYIFT